MPESWFGCPLAFLAFTVFYNEENAMSKYEVSTWADGFGTWHAKVTGPFPKTDGFRRVAGKAIRSELEARGAIGDGYRIRLVEAPRPIVEGDRVSVFYAEEAN